MILFLLGRGVFSISKSIGFLFLLQLPLTGALQNELMTRNAWVFFAEFLNVWVVVCTSSLTLTAKELLQWVLTEVFTEEYFNSRYGKEIWHQLSEWQDCNKCRTTSSKTLQNIVL